MRLYLLLVITLATSAHAASFDCAVAKTDVERIICSSEELSQLDRTLAEIYELELSRDNAAKSIRAAHRTWLESRNRCSDTTCIEHRYEQRIADLACDEESRMAGSAVGSGQCFFFQVRLAERQLAQLEENFANRVLITSYHPEYTNHVLVAEKKAWRVYRDAQCALRSEMDGGSDGWKNAWASACELEETNKRIASLTEEAKNK